MEFRDIYRSIISASSKQRAIESLFETSSSPVISPYLTGEEKRIKTFFIQTTLVKEGTIITSTASTQPISVEANPTRYIVNTDTITTTLNSKYIQGDEIKALQLLECLCDAIDGLLAPILVEIKRTANESSIAKTDFHYKRIQGADNFQMVTCYLDSLLFAMFARIDNFEPILLDSNPEERESPLSTDKNHKEQLNTIRILLRFYISMLRKGYLITTDITQFLLDSIFDAGWSPMNTTEPVSASDPYRYEQQDTSELFYFITESLNMPLLTLKVDIAHGGKDNAEDDHKLINERLLNVPIPGNENDEEISLEECLESYFANSVVVERQIERRRTLDSLDLKKTMLLMGKRPSDADSIINKKGRQFSIQIRSIDTESIDETIVETCSINTLDENYDDSNDGTTDGNDDDEGRIKPNKDRKTKFKPRNANGILRMRSDSTGSYKSLRSTYNKIPSANTISENNFENSSTFEGENLSTGSLVESPSTAPPTYDFIYGIQHDRTEITYDESPIGSTVKIVDDISRPETPIADLTKSGILGQSQSESESESPRTQVFPGGISPLTQNRISENIYLKSVDVTGSSLDGSKISTPPSLSQLRRSSTNSLWTTKNQISLPAWMFLQLLPFYTRVKSIPELSHRNDSLPVVTHFAEARPVLVMCLKRYFWDDRGHAKRNGRTVIIPNTIYLPTFVADEDDAADSEDNSENLFGKFKLVLESAVCHRGGSTHSGHYVGVCNEKKKKGISSDFETKYEMDKALSTEENYVEGQRWLIFDDLKTPEKVEPVDFDQVFSKEFPYLLFYRMVPLSNEELVSLGREPGSPTDYNDNFGNCQFDSDEDSNRALTACNSSDSGFNNSEVDRNSVNLPYGSSSTSTGTDSITGAATPSCPPIVEDEVVNFVPLEELRTSDPKDDNLHISLAVENSVELKKSNSNFLSAGRGSVSRSRSRNRTDVTSDDNPTHTQEKSMSRTQSILRKLNSAVGGGGDKAEKAHRKEVEKEERGREMGFDSHAASTSSSSNDSVKSPFLSTRGESDVDTHDHVRLSSESKHIPSLFNIPSTKLTPWSSTASNDPLDVENIRHNLIGDHSENLNIPVEPREENTPSIHSINALTRLSTFTSTLKGKQDTALENPKVKKEKEKEKKKKKKKGILNGNSEGKDSAHEPKDRFKHKHALSLHMPKKASKASEFKEEKCNIM